MLFFIISLNCMRVTFNFQIYISKSIHYRVIKKNLVLGFSEVPCKDIQKKLYDNFLCTNTHHFHFINQTISLKLKAHFAAISLQKDVVL